MVLLSIVGSAMSVIGAVLAIMLNTALRKVGALERVDAQLTEKIHGLEVLVRGSFVTRDEFLRALTEMFNRIEQKLDGNHGKQ